MLQKPLSRADSKVLAQVFDPESTPGRAEVLIDPSLPADRHILDIDLLNHLKAREREAIAFIEQFEKSGKSSNAPGKSDAFQSAIAILDDLISCHPNYASARNNRAQLRRWRFGDRHTLCQPRARPDIERSAAGVAAVEDLKSAIELSSPARPQDGVSATQGKLLAQSTTQLAALYYAAFKDLDTSTEMAVTEFDSVQWSCERFEEEASKLFYLGGLYGNEVAKALAVHTNPHAKLCGSIVKEAMRKELAGT
ncbi:uncharacterized protein RCC_03536 [Ramularia collo-cygni]|uniref:Uncharacterized protein n=1 Tax=Ramularia collo-cygni TaxID=112498 RepID=A0A2D3V881_9PEZI|nr:uncharacterized protein RCC_03536 [Ramularia collo-cygni]CZT17699.1 uncharacterized protein RCC_03536 [Ramularia collo-cygni]